MLPVLITSKQHLHTLTQRSTNMKTSNFEPKSPLSNTQLHQSQHPNHQFSKESFNHTTTGSGSSNKTDSLSNPQIERKKKKKNQVFLEGYIETPDEEELVRSKSITDDDLQELKGCLDLGFGFSYDEIPELCNTLPALELCYSMSRRFVDEQQKSPECSRAVSESSSSSSPVASGGKANWKISSPGDDPEDVKARLKFWAQAVACTVKLCS